MDPIRIAIVNDYEVVVEGVASMLRAYADRVDIVELDANRQVSQHIGIALYDTYARDNTDTRSIIALSRNPAVAKVVVYSWNVHPVAVENAISGGAAGYLAKQLPARELVEELELIHSGQIRTPKAEGASRPPAGGDWPGREEGLTLRESEILALIAQGRSNEEIAAQAHLSINSVKTYVRRAYRQIGVKDRSNGIIWALNHGFQPDHFRDRNP